MHIMSEFDLSVSDVPMAACLGQCYLASLFCCCHELLELILRIEEVSYHL